MVRLIILNIIEEFDNGVNEMFNKRRVIIDIVHDSKSSGTVKANRACVE